MAKTIAQNMEEELNRTPEQEASNKPNNLYQDINATTEAYKPNEQNLSNTGSGIESALGEDGKPIGYSWEKQAQEKAGNQYKSDVLTEKQNLLNQAQQTANNAVNYQAESDMMKYQNNQNAEKVGWTGGYVLDQNKQMDYLKASIQAQMYGAMELQKYGYDSALAAARLSYDLNQQEYARQYYNDAVSAALSEAQLTGTYFSAETKDMMSQLAIVAQKLEDPNISNEEYDKAERLQKTIYQWFETNGISSAGVKTLEAWNTEQQTLLQWSSELYTRYNAALQTLKQDQQNNPAMFFRLDENGNPIFDGIDVQTIDFSATSTTDALNYVIKLVKDENDNDKYEVTSEAAKQQLYSYFNWLFNDAIAKYKEGVMVKDSNGNVTYNINKQELQKAMDSAAALVEKYIKSEDAHALLDDYEFKNTDSNVGEISYTPEEGSQVPENLPGENEGATTYKLEDLRVDTSQPNWQYNINKMYPAASKSAIEKAGYTTKLFNNQIDFNEKIDDDFDYNIGKKNYDLDADWEWKERSGIAHNFSDDFRYLCNNSDRAATQAYWNNCQAYLKSAIVNPKDGDLTITYLTGENGQAKAALWIYYNGRWGYIQQNTGGNKLLADVQTFMSGGKPSNW